MSGRIWVVEENLGSRAQPRWSAMPVFRNTRNLARQAQASVNLAGYVTRVVQYVRQGGAR